MFWCKNNKIYLLISPLSGVMNVFVCLFVCLCWGLTTHQPSSGTFCVVSQRKGGEIEEIVEEMKERDRGKMNESEETEEIKTLPLYLYLLQG